MNIPLDLRTGINACIEIYMKKHKGKFPNYTFINNSSYLELNAERLLTSADDSGKKYLNHNSSKKIKVYLIKKLPEKIKEKLEQKIKGMEVPIILSKSQKPNEEDVFADLSLSTQELKEMFAEISEQ